MITTLADQYLAQNAGRRYPLADDAGYDDIPDDTAILDFRCTVRGIPAGTVPRAWITNVADVTVNGEAHTRVTVTVERPGTPDVLDFDIPDDIAANAPYTASAASATGAEGALTVSAAVLRVGLRGAKNVPLAWTTVVCDSLKVHSVQSAQDDAEARDEDDPVSRSVTAELTGAIVLDEGRNTEPYLDGNRLRLDVYRGGGLGERCQDAVTGGQTCGTVLFTINGERPGSDGNIRIVGEDGISVVPDPENHAVEIRMDDTAASRMVEGCAPACE